MRSSLYKLRTFLCDLTNSPSGSSPAFFMPSDVSRRGGVTDRTQRRGSFAHGPHACGRVCPSHQYWRSLPQVQDNVCTLLPIPDLTDKQVKSLSDTLTADD